MPSDEAGKQTSEERLRILMRIKNIEYRNESPDWRATKADVTWLVAQLLKVLSSKAEQPPAVSDERCKPVLPVRGVMKEIPSHGVTEYFHRLNSNIRKSEESFWRKSKAVKAAREWLAHARSEKRCPISDTDDALCLAALLDHMMAQARLEEHDSGCGWCHEVGRCERGAELERLAGRGK